MAISTVTIDGIDYFRITRTWNHKEVEIQRYVRIGDIEKQSFLEAQIIDDALKTRQDAARSLRNNNGEVYFHDTGKVVGINRVFQTKHRGRYNDEHMYTVRFNPRIINPRSNKPIRYSSVSIDKHGIDYGYELAVKKLIIFAGMEHNKALKKLMLNSLKYYKHYDPTLKIHQFNVDGRGKIDNTPALETRLKIDFQESAEKFGVSDMGKIESNLLADLEEYQRKNPVPKKHQNRNISNW